MLEFYWAYADYRDLVATTEILLREVAQNVCGKTVFTLEDGSQVDLKKAFHTLTVKEAILKYCDKAKDAILDDLAQATTLAQSLGLTVESSWGLGKVQIEIFEAVAEEKLMHPTFITEYPAEVSPLRDVMMRTRLSLIDLSFLSVDGNLRMGLVSSMMPKIRRNVSANKLRKKPMAMMKQCFMMMIMCEPLNMGCRQQLEKVLALTGLSCF